MNEHLLKLTVEAKLGCADFNDGTKYFVGTEETFSKFAELIVRECIRTVENLSPGYQDYRNQIEDAFRSDCVEQIKRHFGVKE